MLILTIKNKFGYNEELSFYDTPLKDILSCCDKHELKPLTIKDTNCLSGVFTINF